MTEDTKPLSAQVMPNTTSVKWKGMKLHTNSPWPICSRDVWICRIHLWFHDMSNAIASNARVKTGEMTHKTCKMFLEKLENGGAEESRGKWVKCYAMRGNVALAYFILVTTYCLYRYASRSIFRFWGRIFGTTVFWQFLGVGKDYEAFWLSV